MVISVDQQTRKNNGMATETSEISRPVLGCLNAWCINNKLIGRFVEGCCREQTGYIGAMPDLSLRVTSQDIEVLD